MDTSTAALALVVAIALIGALAGAAGFAALVVAVQYRRLARLAERLARPDGSVPVSPKDLARIRDRRLRGAFETLSERVGRTWEQATFDPLTGIANRQTVLARLATELERAARYHRPLSVIIVDLDHFKRFNDSHGHAAGDVILRHVAQLLAANVRSVDLAGRYGGEEFLIVLPETDADAAASLAEKLRRIVGSTVVTLPDHELAAVTLSAGVAGGMGDVLRLDALVRDADAALYSAKALGRDQVYVFREVGEEGTIRRAPIAAEARTRAIDVGKAAMQAAQDALIATLAGRPEWAGKPSTLIADASVALARAIGLPAGELERIRTASLLHDLGKLAIPEEILAKPGDLAASEWRVVAEHPKIGQVVLEQAGALRDAATIVLHHHEWYDGRGYPHGLRGGDIPVGARIVSIVDAYEAMVSGRPYRAAISHQAALAELRRQAGIQFDPELVETFCILYRTGVPWLPGEHDHGHAWGHGAPPAVAPAGASVDDDTGAGAPVAPRRRRGGSGARPAREAGQTHQPTTAELHDRVHERRRRAG